MINLSLNIPDEIAVDFLNGVDELGDDSAVKYVIDQIVAQWAKQNPNCSHLLNDYSYTGMDRLPKQELKGILEMAAKVNMSEIRHLAKYEGITK